MEKDSALYQLMDTRMHSVMNGIVSSDGEYQAILRRSDIYAGELDRMDLSKEIRLLIDRYVSEQNALGFRFGMLAYLLGFSDYKAMFLGKCLLKYLSISSSENSPSSGMANCPMSFPKSNKGFRQHPICRAPSFSAVFPIFYSFPLYQLSGLHFRINPGQQMSAHIISMQRIRYRMFHGLFQNNGFNPGYFHCYPLLSLIGFC